MASNPNFNRKQVISLEGRVPPHSVEAEQAVLGGVMLDRAAWDNVGDVIRAEDFYRPDHQLIFKAIATLAQEAKPCDVVTVSQHLERQGELDAAGGLAYIGTLTRDTRSRQAAPTVCRKNRRRPFLNCVWPA